LPNAKVLKVVAVGDESRTYRGNAGSPSGNSAREVDVLRIYPSVTGHPKLGNEYVDGEGRVGVTAAIRLESVIRLTHYLTTHMLHHYSRYSKIFQYAGIHTDWCIPSRTRSVYRVSLSSCSRKNEGP